MKIKNKFKKISGNWYFLIIMVLIYFLILIFKKDLFFSSLNFFGGIILKIIPVFIIIFVLMILTNYFITPKFIMKHLKEKGIKKWFFVIIGGVLSVGPIYMWYPLLAELRKKGLSYGLISCFLYNRAIKIPLLPIAIFYFGWKYILILSFVMIFISVIQSIMINKLMEVKNENSNKFNRKNLRK